MEVDCDMGLVCRIEWSREFGLKILALCFHISGRMREEDVGFVCDGSLGLWGDFGGRGRSRETISSFLQEG